MTARVNGSVGTTDGGIYNPGQSLAFFKITVKDGSAAAVDLRSSDGTGQALEAIFFAFPTGIIAYDTANANTGVIHVIVDGHAAHTVASLQAAIRALGTSVGSDGKDTSGTVVEAGAGFTVSASAV
jgi:hypothetical protein